MTKSFRFTLIWLAASLVAVLISLNSVSGSLLDGQYVPVGNDSFYHARRILDTAANPSDFYEFDQKIHYPEGSLLTWPWGYDYLMAMIVKTEVALGLANEPMNALAYVPAIAIVVSIALIVGIAVVLGLSPLATLLASLCVAFSALTLAVHAVGMVDHHFIEYQFALAALFAGLLWTKSPQSHRRALLVGVVLGFAPAFQNGLFILQLPLLAAIGLLWVRGQQLPRKSAFTFGAALIVATLLALAPSAPFREGLFEFYLLSWFHLYVATCTAAFVVLTASLNYSGKNSARLAAFSLLCLLPLFSQLVTGGNFLTGRLELLPIIVETKNVPQMIREWGVVKVAGYYSWLILLAPISLAGCLWYLLKRSAHPQWVFFCSSCAFGLVLLMLQFRLHVFGSFALYLPLIVVADRYSREHSPRHLLAIGVVTALCATFYIPTIRNELFIRRTPGNDPDYAFTHGIYPALANQCHHHPGLALASSNAGHYVRFHTDCAVIGNNFLMTSQHVTKNLEVKRLMAMTPEELLNSGVPVRYVFVSSADAPNFNAKENLASVLLEATPGTLNRRFHLVAELKFADSTAFARVFQIEPSHLEDSPRSDRPFDK